jgi:hypothetical protein
MTYGKPALDPQEVQSIAREAMLDARYGRPDPGNWRKTAERVAIALLNAKALEATTEDWRKKYDETQTQLRHMENQLRNFQNELAQQKNLLVIALQAKVGGGSTA